MDYTTISLSLLINIWPFRWAGFRDGVCFHRCVVYFVYDQRILVSRSATVYKEDLHSQSPNLVRFCQRSSDKSLSYKTDLHSSVTSGASVSRSILALTFHHLSCLSTHRLLVVTKDDIFPPPPRLKCNYVASASSYVILSQRQAVCRSRQENAWVSMASSS